MKKIKNSLAIRIISVLISIAFLWPSFAYSSDVSHLRAPLLFKNRESEISQEEVEKKLKNFITKTGAFIKRMNKYERTEIGSVHRISISFKLIARVLMRHAILPYKAYLEDGVRFLDGYIDEKNIEKIQESLLSILMFLESMQEEIEANLKILDTNEAQSHIARALIYHVENGSYGYIFDTISGIDNPGVFLRLLRKNL